MRCLSSEIKSLLSRVSEHRTSGGLPIRFYKSMVGTRVVSLNLPSGCLAELILISAQFMRPASQLISEKPEARVQCSCPVHFFCKTPTIHFIFCLSGELHGSASKKSLHELNLLYGWPGLFDLEPWNTDTLKRWSKCRSSVFWSFNWYGSSSFICLSSSSGLKCEAIPGKKWRRESFDDGVPLNPKWNEWGKWIYTELNPPLPFPSLSPPFLL